MLVEFALAVGASAVLAIVYLIISIMREPAGTPEMIKVADHIKDGVNIFVKRQYRTIAILVALITVPMVTFFSVQVVVSFVIGAVLSMLAAYVGLRVAVETNVRTANAARTKARKAFNLAFSGGAVMGLSVVSFSILGVSALLLAFKDPNLIIGFGFGASLAALFAQIGGGIFTKAADIGADLVGKLEQSIPEDDLRNPAVIADQVGDNVGDCAGRGSDLFESISDDYITAMIIGTLLFSVLRPDAILFPLLLGAVGILSTVASIFIIRRVGWSAGKSYNVGLLLTAVFCLAGAFAATMLVLGDIMMFCAVASGLLAVLAVGLIAHHYTGVGGMPAKQVADASEGGPALNVIAGLTYAFQSPFVPVLVVVAATVFSYFVTGGSLYGIVAANLGTDLTTGFVMASDTFGPISDNAAGIAQFSEIDAGKTLEEFDALGNTAKAFTKAFATASGTVSTIVLFFTYAMIVKSHLVNLSFLDPIIIAGMMVGAALPFLFSSMVIGATGKLAFRMVEEVRRQFKANPKILSGEEEPDYDACVDLATRKALRKMIGPGFVAIVVPIVVGLTLGRYALGAMLLGSLSTSALLSPCFTFGGGLWDNAKKKVESERPLNAQKHAAAVVGDTVGDTLKDVAGPSLNIFMKLMNMTALLIAPLLLLL